MVALDFPDTPTLGQVYDKWTWNGTSWALTTTGTGVGAWTTYTPTFTASTTNPTIGTPGGILSGRYRVAHGMCDATVYLKFAPPGSTANPGAGTYRITVPVPFSAGVAQYQPVGHGFVFLFNGGTRSRNNAEAFAVISTAFEVFVPEWWTASVPVGPTFNDEFRFTLRYEV